MHGAAVPALVRYVLNELDNTVTPLRFDAAAGAFSAVPGAERVSLLPAGTPHADEGGASEIVVSRDGRFACAAAAAAAPARDAHASLLRRPCRVRSVASERPPRRRYATVRACAAAVFNVVSTLSLDGASGGCALVETVPSGGNMPWGCALAGAGDAYLLVQNQHSRPHPDLATNGEDLAANGEGVGVVALFRRDAATGRLAPTEVRAEVPSAMGITVVPL